MNPYVPADIVESTWQRIGGVEAATMLALQRKCGLSQPELTGFVIGYGSDLRPDAMGLLLYTMVVVSEMFRVHHVKVRKARERVVIRQWEASHELIEELRDSGVTRQEIVETDISTSEPFALRYVCEALTEQSESDPIEVNDDEFWQMLAIMKTVIETLHEMAGAERRVR